jgi:N-acetylglucosamine-6-phosphate deacetylase
MDQPVLTDVRTYRIHWLEHRSDDGAKRQLTRPNIEGGRLHSGQTFDEIDRSTEASTHCIQHMIGLEFRAPDSVQDALDGRHPAGFISDRCKAHELPSDLAELRALLATL